MDNEKKRTNGIISAAKMLEDDIIAIDITTDQAFCYHQRQDATIGARIGDEILHRRFSLAGPVEGESTTQTRFMIRRMPDGDFTGWLFDSLENGTLLGTRVWLSILQPIQI